MKKILLCAALLVASVAASAQNALPVANEGVTGTTLNKLVKLTGAPSTATIAGVSDTSGIIGICAAGCGTTGTAIVATYGIQNCVFDNTTVAGHYVQNSSGSCHDAGSTRPTSAQIMGIVLASGAAGTYSVLLNSAEIIPYVLPSITPATLTDGATVTWAIASNPFATSVLTFTTHGGSRTLNITNPVSGATYILKLVQDATGGEGLTLGTGCTWKVSAGGSGAVSLSSTANAVDVLTFFYDGTNCNASLTKNFN